MFSHRVVSPSVIRVRRGLTLMELVVVMTVLAALAAIVLPLFPNLLRRSHKVTEATQTSEVSKAIQLFQAASLDFPNEWDLMTVSDGTKPDFIPAEDGTPFGGGAQIGNLTADEVTALNKVGINLGHHFPTSITTGHPTEDPYAAAVTAPTIISDTTSVFIINNTTPRNYPPEIANIIDRDNTAKFVVFGVGPRSTMVGKVIQKRSHHLAHQWKSDPRQHVLPLCGRFPGGWYRRGCHGAGPICRHGDSRRRRN